MLFILVRDDQLRHFIYFHSSTEISLHYFSHAFITVSRATIAIITPAIRLPSKRSVEGGAQTKSARQDNTDCYSINFKFTLKLCEFNNATRLSVEPKYFIFSGETVYLDNLYRPYRPCDNVSCKNDGTCRSSLISILDSSVNVTQINL